jgi:hypothetical protein
MVSSQDVIRSAAAGTYCPSDWRRQGAHVEPVPIRNRLDVARRLLASELPGTTMSAGTLLFVTSTDSPRATHLKSSPDRFRVVRWLTDSVPASQPCVCRMR